MRKINENLMNHFDLDGTAMETLGISVNECSADKVVAVMNVGRGHYQPFGILHGGLSAVLAETAASVGAHLFIDLESQYAVGLEINVNHLRAVRSGLLRAEARPVHLGSATQVWDIRLYNEQDEITAISRCTMAVRNRRQQFPSGS